MGSCVSVHKDAESAFKHRLSFKSNNNKKQSVIPSPVKVHTPDKSHWSTLPPLISASPDFGSKEESFFDSKPWLESDCDDDFLSVNGDFTPSRGSTPVHHKFSANLLTNGMNTPLPEPSPTDRKKRLSELFSESGVNEVVDVADQNVSTEQKPATETPYVSGANSVCSSESSTVGSLKSPGQKSLKPAQCCLPALRYSRSFKERKNRASPVDSAG